MVLLSLQLARNRSSPRPGARTPVHDVGATGRGLRAAVTGSGAFIGAVRTS
jgi:hypothetical protein